MLTNGIGSDCPHYGVVDYFLLEDGAVAYRLVREECGQELPVSPSLGPRKVPQEAMHAVP